MHRHFGDDRFDEGVERLSVLADTVRRRLYRYVVDHLEPVGRDEAAAGVGVPRHTAKFHLDKLVDEGLLDAEYRRLTERTGPGAGRPAKLYRRATGELELSVPERRYQLAGRLLAEAVARAGQAGVAVSDVVKGVSIETGRSLGEQHRSGTKRRHRHDAAAVVEALTTYGYEPYRQGDTVLLRNCPFQALAQSHAELICSMNLELVSGLIEGLDCPSVDARLAPSDTRCCVLLELRPPGRRKAALPNG
jgi:predicted ArsR family transcriptional regulator